VEWRKANERERESAREANFHFVSHFLFVCLSCRREKEKNTFTVSESTHATHPPKRQGEDTRKRKRRRRRRRRRRREEDERGGKQPRNLNPHTRRRPRTMTDDRELTTKTKEKPT